jgi:hypothetical protein
MSSPSPGRSAAFLPLSARNALDRGTKYGCRKNDIISHFLSPLEYRSPGRGGLHRYRDEKITQAHPGGRILDRESRQVSQDLRTPDNEASKGVLLPGRNGVGR